MSYFLKAEDLWNNFLGEKILDYSSKRNYDYGPKEDSSVSKISHFVTHRILLEYQLINEVNKKYKSSKVNKYLEEIFWRIYWKGWLENHASLWDYFISIKSVDFDIELYGKALEGKTHLPFFNSWIEELRKYNYLHNHTRMWFASTWIYNLGLPWELGAKLFFKYLYDGDAASNLLSWRWVAGLHTKGKKYIFTPDNLRKFSNGRFSVKSINNKNINLKDKFYISPSEGIFNSDMNQKSEELILFENDLHFESLEVLFKKYKKIFLIFVENENREIKLSQNVVEFKKTIMKEFARKIPNIILLNSRDFISESYNIDQFDLIYPCVGENYSFIQKYKLESSKTIHNLVRKTDLYAWKFAKKGFFKFKTNIPTINKFIREMDMKSYY